MKYADQLTLDDENETEHFVTIIDGEIAHFGGTLADEKHEAENAHEPEDADRGRRAEHYRVSRELLELVAEDYYNNSRREAKTLALKVMQEGEQTW